MALTCVLLAVGAWTLGCGGGGAGSVAPPPPPPPSITITVTPQAGTVLLGETLNFSASVSGTPDTAVVWSVNGITRGSVQAGTISADGVYMAPTGLPSGGTVQVTATSHADSSKSATASVTVSSDIAVSVSASSSSVELGATQSFRATVTSSGKPDTSVRWSVAGSSCPNSCGSVDANGNYTAPQVVPASSLVNLTATSVADPSKQSFAVITITSHFALQLSAPSTLSVGTSSLLTAISSNTCSLAGNPISLTRPVSGTLVADICLFSQAGFDTSMSYTISGPGDVNVISKQPAGLGIIHLTLQIPATAAPGERTLFIQNVNLDRTAASGVLRIE